MLTLAVVLGLSLTVGCTTTQKWMVGGAAVGGAIGGAAGAHGCYGLGNAGEGALFGALAGATAGALVGDVIDEKDTQARIKELEAEVSRLQAELNAKNQALEAANRRIAELEAQLRDLQNQLKRANVREVEISLASDVLFKSGSARLSDAGKAELNKAAAALKGQYANRFIMIEGHTDAQPIKASGWKSNWELGAARSLTVLHYLADQGVNPEQLSAATFSKYQPVATNDTAEGRQKNRRSVIVVYKNWNIEGQKAQAR